MTGKKEVVKIRETSPATMMETLTNKGASLEQIEKFMELQERHEANEAKKAYNADMVLVQQEMPAVEKSLKNKQTNSMYADLSHIIQKTKPIYTKHGFSVTFYEGETNKPEHIRIYADVVHKLGHKESPYYDVPLDGKGLKGNANMTPIHAKASSVAYGKRYLMCMVWNIATGDDNDAQEVEIISNKELSIIRDRLAELEYGEDKLQKYLGVEDIEKLPKTMYQKAITALDTQKTIKGLKK